MIDKRYYNQWNPQSKFRNRIYKFIDFYIFSKTIVCKNTSIRDAEEK